METEWILFENPDVITSLVYGCGYGTDDETDMVERHEEIMELPGFADEVTAVKDNRVHIIDNDFFGPGYIYGLAYMAKWLYPDIFADFDPEEIHQEFVDEFCGIDFDVTEEGTFVYP